MKVLSRAFLLVLIGIYCVLNGCIDWHHPDALYGEAPRPPLEKGRTHERKHRYAQAEDEYLQITDEAVREMTLNQLASAWKSVNANIIRAQEQVQQQPMHAESRFQLAQEYYHKGLLCYRYWQEAMGDYPREFILEEQEYYYSASLEQAKTALRLQPTFPEIRLLIGELYLTNHMQKEALQELKQLIHTHPDYAKGYYAVGMVYLEMKRYDKVERYFIRAIKLDPDFLDAYYMLGQFYLEQQWYDYAAYTFLEVLRRDSTDWPSFDKLIEACHQLGRTYMAQERYNQAIALFQAILEVKSSYPVHQSLLEARRKRDEAAIAALERGESGAERNAAVGSAPPGEILPVAAETAPPSPQLAPEPPTMGQLPEQAPPPGDTLPPPMEERFPGVEATPDIEVAQVQLRNTPATLSNREIVQMIQQRGFNHPNNLANWGLSGIVQGTFQHAYQPRNLDGDQVVIDQTTGLMWQQSGSSQQMTWNQAREYIQQLNQQEFAGFSNWRLPTVEELASLLEFQKKNGNYYIDPVFDATQSFCWTSDMVVTTNAAWAVAFHSGHVYYDALDRTNYVRAVR